MSTNVTTRNANKSTTDFAARLDRIEKLVEKLANKSSNNDSTVQPDWADRLERLEARVEELINLVQHQQQQQSAEGNRLPSSRPAAAVPWGCPPPCLDLNPSLLSGMVNYAATHPETVQSKSKRAVIERVPEDVDAKALVQNIVEECGLADKLVADEVHRHPATVRESGNGMPQKPRILKVPFIDQISRDLFLRRFRKNLPKIENAPRNLLVRRDMTPPELSLLYELRKRAYEANASLNQFKFIVVDLRIETLQNPKPFKQNR